MGLCCRLGCSQTSQDVSVFKIENKPNDEGKLISYFSWLYDDDLYYIAGHNAKRAKVDMHLANTGPVPDWLPKEWNLAGDQQQCHPAQSHSCYSTTLLLPALSCPSVLGLQ